MYVYISTSIFVSLEIMVDIGGFCITYAGE